MLYICAVVYMHFSKEMVSRQTGCINQRTAGYNLVKMSIKILQCRIKKKMEADYHSYCHVHL
jgi:hypothetical protein